MKNFENLPYRGSMRKTNGNKDSWHSYGGSDDHRIGDYYPWTIVIRVLDRFIGKHVNKAFSYYCTLVPKYQQEAFWDEIENNKDVPAHWYRPSYYIDKGNNVRRQRRVSSPRKYVYTDREDIESKKTTYFHGRNSKYGRRLAAVEKKIHLIKYTKKYYQGTKGYSRYMAEKQQHKMSKEVIENYYDFNRIKREKKADDEDELIRDNHGFDETSFKGIEYHGGKRKRNKKK